MGLRMRLILGLSLSLLALFPSPAASASASYPQAPAFRWAAGEEAPPGASAEQAALYHAARLGAATGVRVAHVHDTGRGGIVVRLRLERDGVEILHGDLKLLLDRSHRLLAASGRPEVASAPRAGRSFGAGPAAAVAGALRAVHRVDVSTDRIVPTLGRAGEIAFTLAGDAPRLRRPARARAVWAIEDGRLVPAFLVELRTAGPAGDEGYAVVVGAEDGRVLERRDLIARAAYKYRVWAGDDAVHTPLDGPLEDYTPHPAGAPTGGPKDATKPTLVTMEGFNTNPDGVHDPWLPPDAKDTRGNNVDAFAGHTDPDGPEGPEQVLRATLTAPGEFDRDYDVGSEPLAGEGQIMAAITQLFYTTNWLHDWWYDSGFVEAAGNAQADNYGRGGADSDPLKASAQDGAKQGLRDNAYMETPADGESPEMHMFVWSPMTSEVELTVMGQDVPTGQAAFGLKVYDVTAPVAELVDGAGESPTDGCEPALGDLTGAIALIDRGTCSFELKAKHAAEAGAVGALFANNVGEPGGYSPGPPDYEIEDAPIPAHGISKADGAAIRAGLMKGEVTAHMRGDTSPERDGTIDAMVVAHEWGHYLHLRLVECGSYACSGQSEGWADFVALHRSLREGDDLHGTYGNAGLAGFDPTFYYGIRRVPYSVDFTRNALSFRHIADGEPLPDDHPIQLIDVPNSEPHNAGEVWATMLWEVYVALHDAAQGEKSFAEVRRAMSDYVVAGMMLAPPDPTHLEQRDAILAAIAAQDPDDFIVVAKAFARRGAGSCALGPPRYSQTLEGVLEDFEVRPAGAIASVSVDDGVSSCDQDGVVDADEAGRVVVVVRNVGAEPLVGAALKASSSSPSLVFADGDALALDPLAPASEVTLTLPVALAGPLPDAEKATVSVVLTTPGGCSEETVRLGLAILDGDHADGVSGSDDVEAAETLWTIAGLAGEEVWSRQPGAYSGTVWRGADLGERSDGWLASPALKVSLDEPLTISFDHAYAFDSMEIEGEWIDWDGGVLEITRDEGKSWEDISAYGEPGYTGVLTTSNNPLSQRPAFVRTSPKYPEPQTLTVDLGTKLAGEKIRLRFRLGSDGALGGPGWEVDNIRFTGITNTPFAGWVPDACGEPEPTTGEASSGGSDSEGSSGSSGPATGGEQVSQEGCGCRSGGATSALWLVALGLVPRRRRSCPRVGTLAGPPKSC